jgi:RNA polymerase primary sigma factor
LKNRALYGRLSEPMTAKGDSKIEKLTALPGLGAATAKKLVSAKIDTVSKVASAGSKKLQDAGLSAAIATKISAAAKAANKASSTAKKATSKVKSAAKTSAEKSTSAAKSAASKSKSAAKKAVEKVTAQSTENHTVESSKSSDGRKGGTLRIPRSVKDMPWFKKK